MTYLRINWCRKTTKRLPRAWNAGAPDPEYASVVFRPDDEGQILFCWHDHAGPCIFAGPHRSFHLWDEERPV